MTTITVGNTAPTQPRDHLHYKTTANGLMAYVGSTPVAWVYPGYHSGQIDGCKRTVRFVDVAYHRQTQHGVNLETADFQTLDEATTFIAATFGSKAVAV